MDHQAGDQLDERQNLHLEHYLFHQVVIFLQTVGDRVQRLAVKKPGHDARHQPDHIGGPGNRGRGPKSALAEHKGVDGHRDDGLNKHPDNAEVGPHKALAEIRLTQIQYEFSLSENFFSQCEHVMHPTAPFIRT